MHNKLNKNLCMPTWSASSTHSTPPLRFAYSFTRIFSNNFPGIFSDAFPWQTCWHFSLDASHQINARKICICMSSKRVYCKQNICTMSGSQRGLRWGEEVVSSGGLGDSKGRNLGGVAVGGNMLTSVTNSSSIKCLLNNENALENCVP